MANISNLNLLLAPTHPSKLFNREVIDWGNMNDGRFETE